MKKVLVTYRVHGRNLLTLGLEMPDEEVIWLQEEILGTLQSYEDNIPYCAQDTFRQVVLHPAGIWFELLDPISIEESESFDESYLIIQNDGGIQIQYKRSGTTRFLLSLDEVSMKDFSQ